jgi:hypothetical protein
MFDPTAITRDPAEAGGVSTLKRESSFEERESNFEERESSFEGRVERVVSEAG